MGPDQKFLTRVGSGQFFVARVESGQQCQNFQFLPFGSKKLLWVGSESKRVKGGSAPYLLWVKSKFGSGQGPSLAERP